MRHTIAVLVENEFGVLSRVSGLFSGRGFNIESLCVAETMDPQVSRMTIITSGNDQIIEQILKQLNKLVPVLKVIDFRCCGWSTSSAPGSSTWRRAATRSR
ncbi:MAG: acetolactate synthase [Deltaproteobacteria bacterium]|nr:acetolactate synthase [Deltaproteobacteria bacterium]